MTRTTHVKAHTRGHTFNDPAAKRDSTLHKFTVNKLKNKKYRPSWYHPTRAQLKEVFYFENLDPTDVEQLLGKEKGQLDPDDYQNEAPTARELIIAAKKNKGKLGGYVIPIESGRDDARVSLDTIYLPTKIARRYKKAWDETEHPVDEFTNEKKGLVRIWWD